MDSSAAAPQSAMERVADFCARWLERHVAALLVVMTVLYAARTAMWDAWRPLWYDEIFTEQISRLGSGSAIWNALAGGLDTNPPLSYLLTAAAHRIAGPGTLATRLPESAGFWLMCVCLFAFVRHRTSTLFGLAALLFPFATRAAVYSYEARPYGLLLGFTALAVLCWQRADEGRYRRLAVVGIFVGMALALSASYLAILGLLPLIAGQLCRDLRCRVDFAVWGALVLSPLPLIAYRPLVAGTYSLAAGFWAHPSFAAFVRCYTETFGIAAWALLIIPIAAARLRKLVHPELAMAASFLLLPFALLVMSRFTHAFFSRYVLVMVVGAAIAIVLFCSRAFHGSAVAGLLLCVLFAGFFSVQEISATRDLRHRKQALDSVLIAKTRFVPLPLVIDSSHFFADVYANGPRDVAAQVRYLASPADALYYLGTDTDDLILKRLNRYFPMPVENGPVFLESNRQFWLYVPKDVPSWVLRKLTGSGANIEFAGSAGAGDTLFFVTQGASQIPQTAVH